MQKTSQSKKQEFLTSNNSNSNDIILNIPAVNLSNHQLPQYQSSEASGLDLQANIKSRIILHPSDRVTTPTGILIQIPKGFEAQIRSKNGLAKNHDVTVVNSPGTIDTVYRREIKKILINHLKNVFAINDGDRMVQNVLTNVSQIK